MPAETTVLLMEAAALPSSLEEQLSKRGVFTEHASTSDVAQVLPVVTPDLIVQGGKSDIDATIAVLQSVQSTVPLIVIADRGTIRRLKDEKHGDVQALIPQDLPVAAIAHRLSTMAKRAAEGRPIDQPASRAAEPPPKASAKPQISESPASSGRGSQAPAPLAPRQSVKILDAEERAREERRKQEAERRTKQAREAVAARKAAEEQKRAADEQRRLDAQRAAEEQKRVADARKAAEEQKRAAEEQKRLETRQAAEEQKRLDEERRRQDFERRRSDSNSLRPMDPEARAEARRREREDAQRARQERLEQARLKREKEKERRRTEAAKRTRDAEIEKSLSGLVPTDDIDPQPAVESPPSEQVHEKSPQVFSGTTTQLGPAARRPKRGAGLKSTMIGIPAPAQPPKGASKIPPAPQAAPPSRPPPAPNPPPVSRPAAAQPARNRPDPLAATAYAQPESDEKESQVNRTAPRVDANKGEPFRKTDELSAIIPLPVEMRVPLGRTADNLPPIRLALLDTDLTRADAISAALRARGMKIHPVTPDPLNTRWPLLRRFAPQGLVVDEKSMARGAAEWVERFRGDPFLRHIPVILVRFSRLFHEDGTEITLDPLLHLVEPLGREEFALLANLAPGKQVDLWISQVQPFRLVQMLTQEDRNTRLDCRSDKERLVWHLGPGYAGKGKLLELGNDKAREKLSPEESLRWLLSHEDCQVSVHEHTEPLAHASESRDSEVLLHEMTEALGTPERHESLRPPAAIAPSPSQDHLEELSSSNLLGADHSAASPAASPLPPRVPLGPSLGERARDASRIAIDRTKRGWRVYSSAVRSKLAPFEEKVPPPVIQHAPAILATLVALVLFIVILPGDDDEAETEQKIAAPSEASDSAKTPASDQAPASPGPANPVAKEPAAPKAEAKVAEKEEPEEVSGDELWKVAPDAQLPSCEKLLGAAAPQGKSVERSVGYWKNARRLLMVGKTDEAIESMCLAGLYDPSGPAAEGLAEYYLGQRSLAQAERWIRLALKADPESRTARELLGDIENQKGNIKEARKILLDTLLLQGDETQKMQMTARKLAADANLARRGGDLPRAEREQRRAALLSPDSAEIAANLGEILLRRENYEGALKWAKHALRIDPNFSIAMLLAGRIHETQGNRKEAARYFEMIPPGDPYHQQAQHLLSRL